MMSKPPTVSVILPFFNAKKTLSDAIQSIVNQSVKDWELLLIDNNSSDGSTEIALQFCQNDNRIKLYSEPEQGVVFAANLGFEKARGNYLARMDADDVSRRDRLHKQVELLDSKPDVGLASGLVNYVGDDKNGGFIRYVDWLNQLTSPEEIQLNQFAEYPIANPTVMIRRELVEKFGGFRNGNFPEDYEFFLRLQEQGVLMEKVKETIVDWKDSETRLTRTDQSYSQEAFFRTKARFISNWLAKHNPNHPEVCIWGAGKLAKRRSRYLEQYGLLITAYIDIVDNREDTIHYKNTEEYKDSFVLSYVTSWDAREEVREYLNGNGFIEGVNYLVCG